MWKTLLVILLVFTSSMTILAFIDADGDKEYNALYHFKLIALGFSEMGEFDELRQYTRGQYFFADVNERWRFRGFYVHNGDPDNPPTTATGQIVVLPDLIATQDWGAFEWINTPLGAVCSFFVRANGVVMWLTDWVGDFFHNVYLLYPSNGYVEKGTNPFMEVTA